MRLFGIWQELKALLDQLRAPIGLRDAQPISVLRRRPRANVPEFRQVLRREAKHRPSAPQETKSGWYHAVTGVFTLSEQGSWYLSGKAVQPSIVIVVNPGSARRLGGKDR
jgi:hypothetical protein